MANSTVQDIEDDESLDSVTETDDEDIDPDGGADGEDEDRPANNGSNASARKINALETEVADLKKRLGNATRVGGEKLKSFEDDVDRWVTNLNAWTQTQIALARKTAYDEGRSSVENELLDKVTIAEKADYLTQARKGSAPSPYNSPVIEPPEKKRNVDVSGNESANTDATDKIDLNDSATFNLAVKAAVQEALKGAGVKLQDTRVAPNGSNPVSIPTKGRLSVVRAQLEDIDKKLAEYKRKSRADLAAPLLSQRKVLQAELDKIYKRGN